MTYDIREALRLIREGVLLEAEDDKYDLPDTDEEEATPANEPVTTEDEEEQDDPVTDQESDEGDPTEEEPETSDSEDEDDQYDMEEDPQDEGDEDEDGGSQYDMDDEGSEGDDSQEEEDGDQNESEQQSSNEDDSPKPGEALPIDNVSRKILAYKNFRKYRTLRDSVAGMISELTEMPSISDVNREIIRTCIQKGSELLEKLNDYIIYRYKNNSYEVNYKNYMSFVLEKRLIQQILDQMEDS